VDGLYFRDLSDVLVECRIISGGEQIIVCNKTFRLNVNVEGMRYDRKIMV